MAEYIEREAAIKAIYDSDPNGIRRALGFNVGQIEEALRAVPAVDAEKISDADVAPVRHGRWILEREPNGKPYCFHCSVCDDDFHYICITVAYDYCPNCGAKMDG